MCSMYPSSKRQWGETCRKGTSTRTTSRRTHFLASENFGEKTSATRRRAGPTNTGRMTRKRKRRGNVGRQNNNTGPISRI